MMNIISHQLNMNNIEDWRKSPDPSSSAVTTASGGIGIPATWSAVGALATGMSTSADAGGALATPTAGVALCAFMQHWTTRFLDLPLVSVAAISGGAVGGGTELASACDHRLMAKDAVWKMVHARHGLVAWSLVAALVPGRTGKQCRERWYNHLDAAVNKEPWSLEEERKLVQLQREIGNKWADIAK